MTVSPMFQSPTPVVRSAAPAGRPRHAPSWGQLAHGLAQVAAKLATLAQGLPAGEPTTAELRAARRALSDVGQHAGALKRELL